MRNDTVAIDVIGGAQMQTPDTAICLGGTIAIRATSDPRRSWRWSPATALSSDTIINPVIRPATPGTVVYTVRGSYPGCPETVITRSISAEPNPVISRFSKDTTLCAKDTLRLSAAVTPTWSDYRYRWSAPAGSRLSSAMVSAPLLTAGNTSGVVSLVVSTPLAGCAARDSFYLTARPVGFLSVSPSDTLICPGLPALLQAGGAGVQRVRWLPAINLSDTVGRSVTARPLQPTRYLAVGTNNYGCRDSAWAMVNTINVTIELPDTIYIEAGGKAQLFRFLPGRWPAATTGAPTAG